MILSLHFTFGNFLSIFFGSLVGISLAMGIIIRKKKKLLLKNEEQHYLKLDEEIRKKVEEKISLVYKYHQKVNNKYIRSYFGLFKIERKIDVKALNKKYLGLDQEEKLTLPKEILWLVREVAGLFNEGHHPEADLAVNDIFDIAYRSIDLTIDLVNALGIPNIENLRISQIVEISELGGRISEIIKEYNIKSLVWLINFFVKVSNIFNPVAWIKRGITFTSNDSLMPLIYYSLFEIVGIVSANTYGINKK